MVQLMPLPTIISCSSKIQNGLPFWCGITQVVLEKRPLSGCSVVLVCADKAIYQYMLIVKNQTLALD